MSQLLTGYEGVKVFSATMANPREHLGSHVTDWLRETGVTVVDTKVMQSSDEAYHCLSIVVFYKGGKVAAGGAR